MMTAYGSIPVAVEAVKLGAFDFLTKPFRNEDVLPLLAPHRRSSGPPPAGPPPLGAAADVEATIVGRSAAIERVRRMVGNLRQDRCQRPAVRRDRRRQGPAGHGHPPQLLSPRLSLTSRSAARCFRRN